ncbi:hypothetical protein JOD89_005769 [Priestia megaterium]
MKKIKFSTSQELIYSYENAPFNPENIIKYILSCPINLECSPI